jgi:hypothetical protein
LRYFRAPGYSRRRARRIAMPRIYKATTVEIGGTKVHVNQVFGYGSELVTDYTKLVVETGQALVKHILTLKRDWPSDDYFKKYFDPESDEELLDQTVRGAEIGEEGARDSRSRTELVILARQIYENYWKILVGMTREHSIKVADIGDPLGYVSNYENRTGLLQGDIHINKRTISRNEWSKVVITYIHEASHKFAHTRDHGDMGYIAKNGEYVKRGLTREKACVNADSYAWLAWMSAPHAMRLAIPPAPPL